MTPSPATSSPGLSFLLANIGGMGEEGAFNGGANAPKRREKLPKAGAKPTTPTSPKNGGAYPLVVSYATSPAAEVHYSKGKYSTPPTGNLFLKGGHIPPS